jgi:hypothetical protein
MKRSMSRQAEAERERRARVITVPELPDLAMPASLPADTAMTAPLNAAAKTPAIR